jgi:hypothetical protein
MRGALKGVLPLLALLSIMVWGHPMILTAQSQDDRSTPRPYKFELDFYGLGMGAAAPPRGAGLLPPTPPFIQLALVVPARTQQVSSWFFGAGSALTAASNSKLTGGRAVQPLDGVLAGRSLGPQPGFGGGAAVVRRLGNRVSGEAAIEVSNTGVGFTSAARKGIEASRASFQSFFEGVAGTVGEEPGRAIQASVSGGTPDNDVQLSGAFRVSVGRIKRLSPYATFGAGVVRSFGPGAATNIRGAYGFQLVTRTGAVSHYDETDTVRLRIETSSYRPVGILGGGATYEWRGRCGLYFDTRVMISPVRVKMFMDASPHVAVVSDPAISHSGIVSISGASFVFPAVDTVTVVVFDNNQELSPAFPSSLSGPPIAGFQTWSARAVGTRVGVRFGLSYRF